MNATLQQDQLGKTMSNGVTWIFLPKKFFIKQLHKRNVYIIYEYNCKKSKTGYII